MVRRTAPNCLYASLCRLVSAQLGCRSLGALLCPRRHSHGRCCLRCAEKALQVNAELRRWVEDQGAVLPPSKKLDPHGALSIYASGAAPSRAYPNADELMWQRVYDEDGEPGKLWVHGATSTDPKQGRIGDCWFISAMSLLATRDGTSGLSDGWLGLVRAASILGAIRVLLLSGVTLLLRRTRFAWRCLRPHGDDGRAPGMQCACPAVFQGP